MKTTIIKSNTVFTKFQIYCLKV